MLRGSFFSPMDEDPFFAGHRQHIQRMEALFNDFPFQPSSRAMLGLTDGSRPRHNQPLMEAHRNNQLQPFGMFDNMFGSMFKNMRSMMADMQRGFTDVPSNPNGACYTQQSFVSYSKSGNEAPKVYQSSSSVRSGPGGIKETHRTVRDSESGVEKMAIGRHIHDRGHVMERSRNRRTGEEEQNQDFINMDEEDVPSFDSEWREKVPTQSTHRSRGSRPVEHRSRGQRSQIPVRTSRLALPSPVTSDTESPRRLTDTRRHVDGSRRTGQDPSKRGGQEASKRAGQDRRVGFETRRTERRRATPRHRDRD